MNSMCKINPGSPACNHWQREMCGQCLSWKLDEDQEQDHLSGSFSNNADNLMSTDECHRLKRAVQSSLFNDSRGANPLTFAFLLFCILFCISLSFWLLARAFVFKQKCQSEDPEGNCQDRQLGGRSSVDKMMQQLLEKCSPSGSTKQLDCAANNNNELYVPPTFWSRFPINGFTKNSNQTESEYNEIDTETLSESSEVESSESIENEPQVSTGYEETSGSTGEQSEKPTETETEAYSQQDIRKSTESITCKQNIKSVECQKWISEVFAHCNRLLADKTLAFWDDWWLNEQPLTYYQLPRLLSAYECQNVKKQIAREMAAASLATAKIRMDKEGPESSWQLALIVIVAFLALCFIGSMIWLLNSTLRRIAMPAYRDCEYQGLPRKNKCHAASPKSFISFGRPCSPLTRYGPYRNTKVVVPSGRCSPTRR